MKLFILSFLMLNASNLFGQSNLPTAKASKISFPTNLNEKNISKIKSFTGKVVAFEGVIEKIENSRNNTPFYKLNLGVSKHLWTALMFENGTNKVGDKVRVVGYLRPSEPNEIEKRYLDGKYIVLAFGLIDFEHSNFLFTEGAELQRQEWIEGKMPTAR